MQHKANHFFGTVDLEPCNLFCDTKRSSCTVAGFFGAATGTKLGAANGTGFGFLLRGFLVARFLLALFSPDLDSCLGNCGGLLKMYTSSTSESSEISELDGSVRGGGWSLSDSWLVKSIRSETFCSRSVFMFCTSFALHSILSRMFTTLSWRNSKCERLCLTSCSLHFHFWNHVQHVEVWEYICILWSIIYIIYIHHVWKILFSLTCFAVEIGRTHHSMLEIYS